MKKIQLDSMVQFNYLGQLKPSPSRRTFGFVVSRAELEKNEYHQTLYVSNEGRIDKVIKLKTNQNYLFLNDERLLIDLQKNQKERNRLKNKQIKSFYIYDLKNKSFSTTFSIPFNGKLLDVVDENRVILSAQMTEADHILYSGSDQAREAYLKEVNKASLYEDIQELPYYFNGRGFKTGQSNQLFIYDIKADKMTPILEPSFSVEEVILSNDKTRVIYSGKAHQDVLGHTAQIFEYSLLTGQTRVLLEQMTHSIKKIVDMGSIVVFASDMLTYGLNQNPDVYELVDGELRLLNYYGYSFGNSIGTDCRLLGSRQSDKAFNQLYFVSTIDDHSEIKRLSPSGDIETFFVFNGSVDGLIHMQDHLILIAMNGQSLQEVYKLGFDGSLNQLTAFNLSVLKELYVAKPIELICHKESHDVKGFVLLPEDYDPNKKYPMVFDIHGGPKTVYGQVYYHEMQYWVNQGYVVAFCNPRGSDGKGNDFADIRGRYGTIDYEDLMDFVNQLLWEYPAVDGARMYVTGGSYGGFMTNWIVGHTDRFKAAVTQRSISNWMSFYGTSDIGYYFATDQTSGHPICDLDLLYEQSPIKYAMDVKTPLRFIHSDKDYRCPMEQAQQLYAVLKTKGLDTDLIWFKDETHELSRGGKPQARIKRLNDITSWFKIH